MTTPKQPAKYEDLTDAELAGKVYLAIIAHDDELPDSVTALFHEAQRMAATLWDRLKGPYCKADGCRELHTPSFPWCPKHLAERTR
jgi:hypothetical protein